MRNPIGFWRGGVWDPNREIANLHRNVDRLFTDMFSPAMSDTRLEQESQNFFQPLVDVEETPSQYELRFDLPGIKKEDVKIELRDNQLIVSGERKEEREEKKEGSRYIRERNYGMFQRFFTLPTHIDSEKIEANFEDGVLNIRVPKSESQKPKLIDISEKKSPEQKKAKPGHAA